MRGDHDFILVKGTHKKRAHGKLKVSDKAKDYYRVGVLKSGMHTAVLKEINSTCECFSKEVILEEFGMIIALFSSASNFKEINNVKMSHFVVDITLLMTMAAFNQKNETLPRFEFTSLTL